MTKKRKSSTTRTVARIGLAICLVLFGSLLAIIGHSVHYNHVPKVHTVRDNDLNQKVHGQHPEGEHRSRSVDLGKEVVTNRGIDTIDVQTLDSRVKDQLQAVILAKQLVVPKAMQSELQNDMVEFSVGQPGESCHKVCESRNSEKQSCLVQWFNFINDCSILEAAFPAEAGTQRNCVTFHFGRDLPALRHSNGDLLINSRPDGYPTSCDAEFGVGARLCPCGADTQVRTNEVTSSVKVAVLQRLNTILEREKVEDARGERILEFRKGHNWAGYTGGPGVEELIESVEVGRVRFLTSEPGQTCYDVCREQELSCLTHWLETLNDCDILSAAFPRSTSCIKHLYGRELPGYKPTTRQVLLNADTRSYGPACTAHSPMIQKLCGCGFPKGGSTTSRTFNTVYNVQASRYFEWQSRYMHFWAREVNQPGRVTRLLSASKMDHLSEIPTYVAPGYDLKLDNYLPYNKPKAITHWLKHGKPEEDVIIIIDPDCCFIHKVDIVVEEGSPIAQPAFYAFETTKPDNVPNQIAARYCPKCAFVDPIAVPIIIHRKDIEKIAPLWLQKTEEIRRDRNTWPESWSQAPVILSWTAEMFGYVFAAAELGIRHEIHDMQVVTPIHKKLLAPFIHYHVAVPVGDKKWVKSNEQAGTDIPWPLPDNVDEVTEALLSKLRNASMSLPPTGHKWGSLSLYSPEF